MANGRSAEIQTAIQKSAASSEPASTKSIFAPSDTMGGGFGLRPVLNRAVPVGDGPIENPHFEANTNLAREADATLTAPRSPIEDASVERATHLGETSVESRPENSLPSEISHTVSDVEREVVEDLHPLDVSVDNV